MQFHQNNITAKTCEPCLQAVNQECDAKDQCYTCWPGAGCQPLTQYNRLTVSEHGRLSGRHQMKAEIFKRGPISCGIMATLKL